MSSIHNYIIHHGDSHWCKELLLLLNVVSQGGMNCEYELYTHTGIMPGNTQETFQDMWKNNRNTPGCIFPHFSTRKHILGTFVHSYAPHDIVAAKMMPPSGRAHPQLHCVKS